MISQETKDSIDREIEAEAYKWDAYYQNEDSFIMPARLFRFGKHIHSQMLTKYAEKLEEKDKAYNELGVKFDKEVERWQERDTDELEKRLALQTELAQLKEITKNMADLITEWCPEKVGYKATTKTKVLTAYAEWCKQNLK